MTIRLVPLPLAVVAAAALTGCGDRLPIAASPAAAFRVTAGAAAARDITVMAQNLYVGADVDRVIGALVSPDPDDDAAALFFAIETLGKTAYPARAEAIADEIARARPHAVGLQEVSNIDIDLRALGEPIEVHLDFLAILQDALARRGLDYQLAAIVQNIDAQLLGGLVRLVDHDALLVDARRVSVVASGGQNFVANVGEVAPGIALIRGWVWADAEIDGARYKIVSAHTEADLGGASLGGLRALQVSEIVAAVAGDARVILMGDLNDRPGSPMYRVLAAAGFIDAWRALRPGVVGNTCCHAADLSNALPDLTQRIDYIFTRGLERPDGKLFGQIDRLGEVPADKLEAPARIWPSDHVGLIAALH